MYTMFRYVLENEGELAARRAIKEFEFDLSMHTGSYERTLEYVKRYIHVH